MPDRDTILNNCDATSGWQGVAFNINAERLYDLLESTRTRAGGDLSRTARQVLTEMENAAWRVTAGIHAGGFGGGGRPADPRHHITLRTNGGTYHLRFHSSLPRLIQIT